MIAESSAFHFLKSLLGHVALLSALLWVVQERYVKGGVSSTPLQVTWIEAASAVTAAALEGAAPAAVPEAAPQPKLNMPDKTVITRTAPDEMVISQAHPVSVPSKSSPLAVASTHESLPSFSKIGNAEQGASTGGGLEGSEALTARDRYMAEVRNQIEHEKFYPQSAKLMRQVGIVEVSFSILRDGTIQSVQLAKASRFPQLNRAGIEILQRIEKFRPLPREIAQNILRLTVPIQYELR